MTERIELSDTPHLKTLLARAVVSGRRRGDRLPDVEVVAPEVRIMPADLAAYSRVCGIGVGARIPVTYPHVLAFPLALTLMTRSDFPLPLLGSVHVENHTSWTRPVLPHEPLAITVRAADLRSHRRGRAVDIVTDVRASGEQVWQERSVYLAPGAGADPAASWPPPPDASALTVSPSRIQVPGDIGRRYAAISGDLNPIHLSALSARPFGFRAAIAHGMWAYTRLLGVLGPRVPTVGESSVWFRSPIPLGASVRVAVGEQGELAALLPLADRAPHLVVGLTRR